ncbi:hypothetical protein GGR56DRAFT_606781 [Xylariaceae sp. FL0804]|nr:hypothetical protein GGR56DRAFT_606781 [Xylariaceae sp. FL0804]
MTRKKGTEEVKGRAARREVPARRKKSRDTRRYGAPAAVHRRTRYITIGVAAAAADDDELTGSTDRRTTGSAVSTSKSLKKRTERTAKEDGEECRQTADARAKLGIIVIHLVKTPWFDSKKGVCFRMSVCMDDISLSLCSVCRPREASKKRQRSQPASPAISPAARPKLKPSFRGNYPRYRYYLSAQRRGASFGRHLFFSGGFAHDCLPR